MNLPDTAPETGQIEKILGHYFADKAVLIAALTRRSFWHENRDTCIEHNERLEFLGDAVLGLVIADILYRESPEAEEGELQKRRAALVNRGALAGLTRCLSLARFIKMGKGDELTGCRDNDSILADTLEALVAAVYIDGGYACVRDVIQNRLFPLMRECSTRDGADDYKSIFQEKAQAKLGLTPTYRLMDQWGEEHRKTFSVAVYLGPDMIGRGTGPNKRGAEQNAARDAIERLDKEAPIIEEQDGELESST